MTADLFPGMGEHAMTPAERKRLMRKTPKPNGYAYLPGTGPAGETCATCQFSGATDTRKRFYKCSKNRAHWTAGRKTDILIRSPACKEWKREEKTPA